VLESAARAITYFLDVHVDSTARKVVDVPGAVAAFCKTLVLFPISDSTDPETARLSRDVAEQVQRGREREAQPHPLSLAPALLTCLSIALFLQSVKVLELLCRREAKAVFEADGLQCLLTFVNTNGHNVHKDTLQCSLSVQLHPTSHITASVVSYLPPSSWGMCGEV
jgi:E3 ubiquitin-protein ligase HECTD1